MRDTALRSVAILCSACAVTEAPSSVVDEVLPGEELEVVVGGTVVLTAPGAVRGSWEVDGRTFDGPTVELSFDTPGNRYASFRGTSEASAGVSREALIGVHRPVAERQAVSARAVVLHGGSGHVLTVVPEANLLVAVSPDGDDVRRVSTCAEPTSVAWQPSAIAVVCEGSDQLWLHDADTLQRTGQITLGDGVLVHQVTGRDGAWWVALEHGEVLRVDGADITRWSTGPDPRGLTVLADGSWIATRWRSPPDRGVVYRQDHDELALALDPGPDDHTKHRGVLTDLREALVSRDGSQLFVAGTTANNQRGLARDGLQMQHDFSLRASLRVIDLDTWREDVSLRAQFDDKGSIHSLVSTRNGTWIWVLHQGAAIVSRLDAFTLEESAIVGHIGHGATGLALSEDDDVLYVHAWLDREVRAYDVSSHRATPKLMWAAKTVDVEPLDPQVLAGKILFHDADDTNLSEEGYVRCASCHPDGRQDGRVWDVTHRGEGFRNTISLRGRAGTELGPLHWTGNYDEVQDFEIDIVEFQRGVGFLHEDVSDPLWRTPSEVDRAGRAAELDALAAYVSSLDTFPPSPFSHSGDGEARFLAAGCDTCHDPSHAYTDSRLETMLLHDVGTWAPTSGGRDGGPYVGFDTPPLRGVWATAPYLHDGSAATLEEAIRRHQLDGDPVTEEDILEIASWLRSL